jgi:hypothetical protein
VVELPPSTLSVIARLLSGEPVEPSEVAALMTEPDATIARRTLGANGEGRMGAFNAAITELIPNESERESYRRAVLDVDPTASDDSAASPSSRFVVYTAKDALQPQPPIDWIVERLISAGSVSAVVGDGGSKKTWLVLCMAVCVALGKYWLDFITKCVRVLIVDEESGKRRLGRRLNHVLTGYSADESTPIFYTCLSRLNLRESSDAAALHALIIDTGAQLVIIDALADVMPGGDENSVKDMQPVFMALRSIAEATQAAIVIIHHSGKAGGYRGSSAIKGAVDTLLMVESKPDSNVIQFSFEKARDVEPFTFAAEAHFEPGAFYLTSSTASKAELKLGKAQRYVMRFLKEHGPSEIGEIASHADSCSPESARRAVYSLADLGLVRRMDDGGSGQKATYALAEKSQVDL